MENNTKWKTLSFKDKTAYTTAIASFILGWCLLLLSFFTVPIGVIDSSIISCFGVALIYTASVLGISLYFTNQLDQFKQSVIKKFADKMSDDNQ